MFTGYDKLVLKGLKGAPKNDEQEQKPDLSLLPLDVLQAVARSYEYGLVKYFRNSWRKGFRTNRNVAAAKRHISNWQDEGQLYDKDAYELSQKKVHHIAMAIFNLLCILDAEVNHPELVENYVPVKFETHVPLSEEEALRIEARRLLWVHNEDPVEFQKVMTSEEIISEFEGKRDSE